MGDAPGHLAIALRWWRWWQDLDPFPPVEPLPPVVHLSLAWARQVAGDQLDDLHLAMAAWSALLVAAATWAAARGGAGLAGAALAGLVTLHAPHMTVVSRQFLLDGPATAVLLLALGAAWGSRGFRHPLRSLLAGLLVGALVVVKYSLLPWLLAPVLLWTLAILARHPAGWLPLLGTAGHLAWWGQQLWARRALQHLPVELPRAPLVHLALSLVVLLLLAGGVGRWRAGRAADALRRGLGAAVAAHGALLVAMAWLWWSFPTAWRKVEHEALREVRAAGWDAAWRVALTHLVESIPLVGWALLVAGGAGLLAAATGPRGRATRAARNGLQALAAALVGTWALSRSLPVDVKYYAPITPLVAVGLAVGWGAHPVGRRLLAPLASAAVLALLLSTPTLPTRAPSVGAAPAPARGLWRLPAVWVTAPPPAPVDWEGAAERVTRAAFSAWPARRPAGCGGYVLEIPSLPVVEDRAFMVQGQLLGFPDEHWAPPAKGLPPCGGIRLVARPDTPPPPGGRVLATEQPEEGRTLQAWILGGP